MLTKIKNKKENSDEIRKMTVNNCNKCGKELVVGDSIFTKRSNVFKWYHEECAKIVNLI